MALWKKITGIIGSILLLASFAGVILKVENTYAKKEYVNEEIELVSSKIDINQLKNDYRFYQGQLNRIEIQIRDLKDLLRKNPDDIGIKQDYEDAVKQRDSLKKTMDDIWKQIK
jgi:hypothetical protein